MKKVDTSVTGAIAALSQYGALCFRETADGGVQVLLVTSRDTGRWVIPKGWPMNGRTPSQSAAREAYEEAGVEGKVYDRPVGLYSYRKVMADGLDIPCVVTVFPLRADKLCIRFPERHQRERHWFAPEEAAALVAEPELADMLRSFDPTRAAQAKAKSKGRHGR